MSTIINASAIGLKESVDTSGSIQLQTANTAAITITINQDVICNSTGAITVPVGTTAQKPTGVNGMIRYNSNTAKLEFYANNDWQTVNTA
jgi:hypothetical protein